MLQRTYAVLLSAALAITPLSASLAAGVGADSAGGSGAGGMGAAGAGGATGAGAMGTARSGELGTGTGPAAGLVSPGVARGGASSLALQLRFLFQMGAFRGGLMGASPERPGHDKGGLDALLRKTHGNAADLLDRPMDEGLAWL